MIDELFSNFKQAQFMIENVTDKLDEKQLNLVIQPCNESLAVLMKHISGHLKSRFYKFWEVDGNKKRNKEYELSTNPIELKNLKRDWEESWETVYHTLSQLDNKDLLKFKKIRGRKVEVLKYLIKVYSHTMLHTGEIIMLSKLITKNNKFMKQEGNLTTTKKTEEKNTNSKVFLKNENGDILIKKTERSSVVAIQHD